MELFAVSQNPAIQRASHFRCLYETTLLGLKNAFDLVKGDQKDAARDWWRYFSNSQIDLVLADSGQFTSEQINGLRRQIQTLKEACHPADVPNYATDLQAIRACLEKLVELAEQNQSPVFPFFSADKPAVVSGRAGLTGFMGAPRQATLSAQRGN